MEMKCKKYFYISQGYSGERCGPWASCFLKFDIGHIFWMVNDRAFVFHMCAPYDKTFLLSGGGIRCPGGVSIPCLQVTPTVSPVSWSWMQRYTPSKSVCQIQSKFWYEKCQTTYGSMKVSTSNYELDHCNGHIICETLTSNMTAEILVTSTFLSSSLRQL
jgi:hypothetical protein